MKDAAAQPISVRLHALISRLSRDGDYVVEQADVAEGVARIVQLERALASVLDHIAHVSYFDAGGRRLGDTTAVVAEARTVLGKLPPSGSVHCLGDRYCGETSHGST
jgi:3-methyladenine DNA glycosylase/8-oxoguanine DNA glycosylase